MTRPFETIYRQTLSHLHHHGCGTYPFGDGENLIARVAALKPNRILELGTALGYTSCCFAKAAPMAKIDTIEADADHVALARANFVHEGYGDRVTVHHGKFEDILPSLTDIYNIAFFDGFAPELSVILAITQRLADGATLICANLNLAPSGLRQRLQNEFLNPTHWQLQPTLENGGTIVATRRSS